MKISILTSLHNEEKTLSSFLAAVLSQELPPEMEAEFLICDDGSTDSTPSMLKRELSSPSSINTQVLTNKDNKGQQISLNELFKRSIGDIVVFIDGDAIPQGSDWLLRLVGSIIAGNAAVVQGNYWKQYGPKTFVVSQHEKWRRSASLRRFGNIDGTLETVNTRNLAIARPVLHEVWKECGYILNPGAVCGADTELGFTIRSLGHSIFLQEDAVIAHDDPVTLIGIMKQKIHHGYHNGLLGISYPRSWYYAVYYPYINDRVSPLFSIPVGTAFTIANYCGLAKHALRF